MPGEGDLPEKQKALASEVARKVAPHIKSELSSAGAFYQNI